MCLYQKGRRVPMKYSFLNIIMILVLLLLTGCDSNKETYTVKDGQYVMEQNDMETQLLPQLTISEENISFSYDMLSSYLPYGTYSINEDKLTMKTDDHMYHYVFQIDGDSLIFQKDESSPVDLIDCRVGVNVADQTKYLFKGGLRKTIGISFKKYCLSDDYI